MSKKRENRRWIAKNLREDLEVYMYPSDDKWDDGCDDLLPTAVELCAVEEPFPEEEGAIEWKYDVIIEMNDELQDMIRDFRSTSWSWHHDLRELYLRLRPIVSSRDEWEVYAQAVNRCLRAISSHDDFDEYFGIYMEASLSLTFDTDVVDEQGYQWDAIRTLVGDLEHQGLHCIPFLTTACFVNPSDIQIAVLLRSRSDHMLAILIAPLTSTEVECTPDAFQRSLDMVDQDFLDSQDGQRFLDDVYEELTGQGRQIAMSLPPHLRRCLTRFTIPSHIVEQIKFDADPPRLQSSVNRNSGDVITSIGVAGCPCPSKATLRPEVFDGHANYGQDSACAGTRDIHGPDGTPIARATWSIIADGHGMLEYGIEWSAGAVSHMNRTLASPLMDELYLRFRYEMEQPVIAQTLSQLVEEARDDVYQSVVDALGSSAKVAMDSCGTTLAINLCVTFLQGRVAGRTRLVTVTLGDSSIALVELGKTASVQKSDGWDTPTDYAEYLEDLEVYNHHHSPVQPCRVLTGRADSPEVFTVRHDMVIPNHRGIVAQIFSEYGQHNQAVVGGVQVSAERQRIVCRSDGVRYRIYGYSQPTFWSYIGAADTGAVGVAPGVSPQFRSSFGDEMVSRTIGLLNIPKITFRSVQAPFAVAVMSDGMADTLSDPEIIKRLTEGLQSRESAAVLAQELTDRTREIAELTWRGGYDDISCSVTMIHY